MLLFLYEVQIEYAFEGKELVVCDNEQTSDHLCLGYRKQNQILNFIGFQLPFVFDFLEVLINI